MSTSRIIQTVLFIVMEAAWIGALAMFVDTAIAGTGNLAVLVVLALYPLGLAAQSLVSRAPPGRWLRRALRALAFVSVVAIATLVAFPPGARPWDAAGLAFFVEDVRGHRLIGFVCIGLFCWIRGAMLQGRELSTDSTAIGFQIGIVALLIVLGLSAAVPIHWPGAEVLSFALVFSGLLALWHIRAETRAQKGGSARRNPAAALIGLLMVLLLGFGIVAAFDRSVLDQVVALAARIGDAMRWFLDLLYSWMPGPRSELPPGTSETDVKVAGDDPPPFLLPENWRQIFGVSLFAIFGIAIAIILFDNLRVLLGWLLRPRNQTQGLEFERSQQGFADTMYALWRGLASAFARLRALFGRREAPGAAPVRLAYLQMQHWMARRGWPRRRSETPFEYAARIKAEWPAPAADLDLLTRAYVNARYGYPRNLPTARLGKLLRKVRRSVNQVTDRQANAEH